MNQSDIDIKKWVSCWVKAAPQLQSLRHREIRNTDTAVGIGMFDDAFESAMLGARPDKTSGLVRQQMYFGRVAK
jgi:hypothetical protein